MTTVDQQIENAASAISSNIDALRHDRPLLAQNILSQLRNLVEGVAVRLHVGRGDGEFQYSAVGAAISHVGSRGQVNFVARFHKLLQMGLPGRSPAAAPVLPRRPASRRWRP